MNNRQTELFFLYSRSIFPWCGYMSKKWSLRPCCTHNNAKNNALIWTDDIQLCELLVDEHFAPSLRPVCDSWPILQLVQNIEKWNSSSCISACFDLKIGFPGPHVTGKHVVKFQAGLRLLTDSTANANHRTRKFENLWICLFWPENVEYVPLCDG